MYYIRVMAVDWSKRGEYIAKHGITVTQANEALADVNAVTIVPDPASITGRTIRTIGFATSSNDIIVVITLEDGGVVYGVNAWRSNDRDRRTYTERKPYEQT